MTPPGAFVEIGVYKGGSAWHLAEIAKAQKRPLYLYDTFTGIPFQDAIDYHKVGDFGDTSFAMVRDAIPYATVIRGVFPATYVEMGPIAFAHVDADQYQSIKDACERLGPNMVNGGVILFDDYGYIEGATKAVNETGWPLFFTSNAKAYVRFFK